MEFIIEYGSCELSDCPMLPGFFAQNQDRYGVSKPPAMPGLLLVPVEATDHYIGKPRACVPKVWLAMIIPVYLLILFEGFDFFIEFLNRYI